jgi:hypothetical protein
MSNSESIVNPKIVLLILRRLPKQLKEPVQKLDRLNPLEKASQRALV